ncbi:MAG: ABC-2 transporter permease [Chloroflexota bacterium]
MQKILTVAWKQLQGVYADTSLLLFMLVTPVMLATIIGLAFGSSGGTLTIEGIPIAVVNLDEGSGDSAFGETIANVLLSDSTTDTNSNDTADNTADDNQCSLITDNAETDNITSEDEPLPTLETLFNAIALDDADIARAGVDDGTYDVAVIIPADFSATLSPDVTIADVPDNPSDIEIESAILEIYSNGGAPIGAIVTRSVTEAVINDIVNGTTTVRATLTALFADSSNLATLATADEDDFANFGCAFGSDLHTVRLNRLPLDDVQAESSFVQIMVGIGAAQAVFFAIFTMNNSLLTVYNDKRQWILQRLLMTPTPRNFIIIGKILGASLLVLFQVGVLLLAMTVVSSIVMGEWVFIWGDNILYLLLLTLAVSLSVAGLGVFVIGLAQTPEQANIFGTLTALGMAMLGGAFGFQIETLEQLSIIYWGVDGYSQLSGGSTDILMNLLILLAVGAVLFLIGSWLFNRRIEV